MPTHNKIPLSPLIAPSILSADQTRLGEEIRALARAGADWLHVDVMDGHFVPNLTIGPPTIKALRKITQLPFDVHLMIETPEHSVQQYIDAGANGLTIHIEATTHLHRLLLQIRNSGLRAGVALNPSTSLQQLAYVLPLLDVVLIMTVNPGFGGQSFIHDMLPKVQTLRHLIQQLGLSTHIQVDGGISPATISEVARAGADIFVSGDGIFKSEDYHKAIQSMRKAATESPFIAPKGRTKINLY